MGGVGEHVEDAGGAQPVAVAGDQDREVAGERLGAACDVDDARGGDAIEAFDDLQRTRARRIDQHAIEGALPERREALERVSGEAATCKNVYCHGAGVTGTSPKDRAWYDTSGAARRCDGCHESPPGAPHTGATSCWVCHPSVIDPGPKGPVVSVPSRHVNGETDR